MQNDSYDTSHILVPHECPIFQSHLYIVDLCDKVRHTLHKPRSHTRDIRYHKPPPPQNKTCGKLDDRGKTERNLEHAQWQE